jgi:hypothetical protein
MGLAKGFRGKISKKRARTRGRSTHNETLFALGARRWRRLHVPPTDSCELRRRWRVVLFSF